MNNFLGVQLLSVQYIYIQKKTTEKKQLFGYIHGLKGSLKM